MKKVLTLLLIAAMTLAMAACGQKTDNTAAQSTGTEQDLLAQIKERGSIIIATEGDWVPWTFHDDNDQLTGFDVEMGQLIADGLGVKADFRETAWASILAGIDSGRFDIACNGVGYSEERAEKYTFSDPYVYDRTVLVVREDNTDIQTFEDLKGKTTTNSPSSLYAALAESYGASVEYVDTLNETLAMITDGRVDATVNAEVSINDYLKEHPDAPLKVVDKTEGAPIVFPVAKGDSTKTLIAEINRILEEARQDGRLAELSMKYFGLDMTTP